MTDKNGSELRLKDKERRIFSDFFVLQLKRFDSKIKKNNLKLNFEYPIRQMSCRIIITILSYLINCNTFDIYSWSGL